MIQVIKEKLHFLSPAKLIFVLSLALIGISLFRIPHLLMDVACFQHDSVIKHVVTGIDMSPPPPPKPLIVYIAGSPRSGSTYIYNLVRILMRQRDPNTIHGWYEDLSISAALYASPDPPISPAFRPASPSATWKGSLDAYRHTGTSVLVKVHALDKAILLFKGCDSTSTNSSSGSSSGSSGATEINSSSCPVDLVIQPYRDIVPQLASIKRMGWGNRLEPSNLANPFEFCRIDTQRPGLKQDGWKNMTMWVLQGKALVMCHREWQRAAGPKLAVTARMEDLQEDESRLALANNIIRAFEQHDQDDSVTERRNNTSNDNNNGPSSNGLMDAVAAVKEADRLRSLNDGSWQAVNPITHFHRGHVAPKMNKTESDADADNILKARACAIIQRDSFLQQWRHEVGYATMPPPK